MEALQRSIYLVVTVFFIGVFSISCGTRQEGETRVITDNKESEELTARKVEDVEEYPIPTSVEVVELLQRAGAPYILGISNPALNVDKYFTERSKALNLGVYGADLSYAATYEMNQDIRRYLQVCKQLIDELNVSTTFNQDFVDRVENNLGDKDSLIYIVAESFLDTYNFLNETRRSDLSLLVMTGSWIEGMYLTSQIAIGARDNTEITDIIFQQDEPLEKLLSLMEDLEDDTYVSSLYPRLEDIYEFLENLESPMANDALDSFVEKIENIRSDIIE